MRADKEKVIRRLKTARGQLDGLLKMVEEDRYCIDISNQLLATQAILASVNRMVLRAHMEGCVEDAFREGDVHDKIEEVLGVLDKLAK